MKRSYYRLTLMMEEGAMIQGMQRCNTKEVIVPQDPLEECDVANMLVSSSGNQFWFVTSRILRK